MSKKKKRVKLHLETKTVHVIPATIPIDCKIIQGTPVWGISKGARKAMGLSKKDVKKIFKELKLKWKKHPW